MVSGEHEATKGKKVANNFHYAVTKKKPPAFRSGRLLSDSSSPPPPPPLPLAVRTVLDNVPLWCDIGCHRPRAQIGREIAFSSRIPLLRNFRNSDYDDVGKDGADPDERSGVRAFMGQ